VRELQQAWLLKKSEMETIREEETSAGQRQDSGFDSDVYVNVDNVSNDYENVFASTKSKAKDVKSEAKPPPKFKAQTSLNVTRERGPKNASSVAKPTRKSPPKDARRVKEEEPPIYENFGDNNSDYQNMFASKPRSKSAGRVSTKKHSLDEEVYAQVRVLRERVREVNAMLEDGDSATPAYSYPKRRSKSQVEKPSSIVQPGQSAVTRRKSAGPLIVPGPPKQGSRNEDSEEKRDNETPVKRPLSTSLSSTSGLDSSSERRRAHFRALLSRFDGNNNSNDNNDEGNRTEASIAVSSSKPALSSKSSSFSSPAMVAAATRQSAGLIRHQRQKRSLDLEQQR